MKLELKPNANIMLIEPPFYRFFNYERWHYPTTLTILGSYLHDCGHKVSILDADMPDAECRALSRSEVRINYSKYGVALQNEQHPIWSEVLHAVDQIQPDYIGFTSVTPKIDSANTLARMIKQRYGKKIITMLGGPHVEGMLLHFPDYNFGPFYDLVITELPQSKYVIFNRLPKRSLILGLEGYRPYCLSSVLTSIGCPNRCTFCVHSMDDTMRKIAYRDAANMEQEVEEIIQLTGQQNIYVMDDCLLSGVAHFKTVSQIMKAHNLSYSCGARVMAVTGKNIDAFVSSGGKKLVLGIESGSQKILDAVKKRLNLAEVANRTRLLREAGVTWSAFFVVGFPFETVDDLKKTEELIYQIKPTFVSLNRFTPYPGALLYETHYKNKPIEFRDLFQLNQKSVVRLSDEMEEYIDKLFIDINEYNEKQALHKNA